MAEKKERITDPQRLNEILDTLPLTLSISLTVNKDGALLPKLTDQEGNLINIKQIVEAIHDDIIQAKLMNGDEDIPLSPLSITLFNFVVMELVKENKDMAALIASTYLIQKTIIKAAALGYLLGRYITKKDLELGLFVVEKEAVTRDNLENII